MQKESRAGSGRGLLLFLTGICLLALLVMVWALNRDKGQDSSVFIPPPFEKNALQGEPDVPPELGYSQLDAQAFRAAVCGAPVVLDGEALLYFTNPEDNEVWLKVRILDANGTILGESGLLRPGEYVEAVELSVIPKENTVELKLMAYEPETYHSAGAAGLSTTLYIE